MSSVRRTIHQVKGVNAGASQRATTRATLLPSALACALLAQSIWVGSARATVEGRSSESSKNTTSSSPKSQNMPGSVSDGSGASPRSPDQQPTHTSGQPISIVVILVGDAATEPTLFERIRTLLPSDSRAELRIEQRLRRDAVLQPDRPGVVYSWVTRSAANSARVYLALRDPSGKDARFLFREVRLENGFDEVGIETLAQVTHSSAAALWGAAQQITRRELAAELERERQTLAPETAQASASDAVGALPPATVSASQHRDVAGQRAATKSPIGPHRGKPHWQLELGPQLAAQHSGSEEWLAYPGAIVALAWNDWLTLRANFGILVPTHFDAGATRVALSGYKGDLRLGFGAMRRNALTWRVESGLGAINLHWTPHVEPDVLRAGTVSRPNTDHRGHAVVAAAIGKAWSWAAIGVRLEAVVPFQKTVYESDYPTQNVVVGRSWLSFGGALEMTFPLARF